MTTRGGQDPALLRQINSSAVLQALHAASSTTISDLARHVGISRRTANEITMDLVSRGWAIPVDTPPEFSVLGRPAQWYAFHERAGAVVAITIEKERIVATATDLRGIRLGSGSATLSPDSDAAVVVRQCVAATKVAMREAGLVDEDALALAVSCTGIIGTDGTVILSSYLPALTGFDLRAALDREFSCPVLIENDCRAALAAEIWQGAASAGSVIYVSVGEVLGCAYSVDGAVYRGTHGAAAEVGLLDAFGWKDAMALITSASPNPTDLARTLALGIAALVATVDPSSVVVAWRSPDDSSRLAQELAPILMSLCSRPIPTGAAALHDHASLVGAVRIALDSVEAGLFTPGDHRLFSVLETIDSSVAV